MVATCGVLSSPVASIATHGQQRDRIAVTKVWLRTCQQRLLASNPHATAFHWVDPGVGLPQHPANKPRKACHGSPRCEEDGHHQGPADYGAPSGDHVHVRHCCSQVDVDKPLGMKLAQSTAAGGGIVVQSASGNAKKAGIEAGDTIIYCSSYFGDELWCVGDAILCHMR